MPNPDNIKLLYNELKDSYDIESEDAFREYLSDANNREALRKELEADYDVGDSASFATYLGFGNEPSKPQAPVQPVAETPQDEEEFGPDTTMRDGTVVKGQPTTASPVGEYDMDANAEVRQRMYKAGMTAGENIAQPFHKEIEAEKKKGLTEEQRRAALQSSQNMLDQVNQGNQHIKNIGNYYQQRFAKPMGNTNMISLDKDKGVSSIANTRNVVEGREFNEESGKFEKTYTTQAGNKYREELPAVEEQAQIDAIFNKDIQSEEEAIDERIAENEAAQQAAMQRVRQEREAARSEHPVISAINEGLSGRNPYLSADIYENDNEIRSLRIERKQLEDAKRTLQAGKDLKQSENKGWTNFWGFGNVFTAEGRETIANNAVNIFRGMEDAVSDLAFWDLGKSELDLGVKLKVISDKLEGGKELTDEELRIATAASLMNAVSGMVGENLPRGYKAGKTTAEMAPFMFQMAFSPLQGTGKALARQMVRKYGRDGLRAIWKRVTRRIGGDVLQSVVLANTWQAGKTAGDILQRSAGEAQMGYDEGGKITLGGFDESKGLLQSAYEAEMVAGIENFTEMMGDMGIGSAVGKGVGYALGKAAGTKVGKALGIGKVTEFFEKASTSQIAKTLQRFEDKVHWNGNFGEIMEEQYGTALNSLFGTGEAEWGDFVDLDKQLDIILGVGLFGGAMSTIKTLGYPYEKHKNKVKLSKADDIAWMLLGGNRGKWGAIRDAIDKSEDKNLPVLLSTILEDEQYNNEQKRAILDYAFRLKAYQGSEKADMLARMEGTMSAEQKESADVIERENEANGVDRTDEVVAAQNIGAEEASNVNVGTEEPQEGQQTPAEVQVAYLTSLNNLLALDNGEQFRSLIDETIAEGNDPMRMSETANIINGVSADERQIILDYIKARSERQGVIDKARNEANLIWLEYAAKFEPAQDENGTLTTGTWNGQVVVIKNWDNESDLVKILDTQGNEITVRRADLEGTIALNQPFEDWVNTNTADRVNALMNGVMAELGELATNGTNEPQESVGGDSGVVSQEVNGEGGAKPAEDGGPSVTPDGEIPPTGDNSPTPPTEPVKTRLEEIEAERKAITSEDLMLSGRTTNPVIAKRVEKNNKRLAELDEEERKLRAENNIQPRTEGGMPLYEEGGKMKPDFKNATSEETYNYLYGERKMNRDDINAFVRNKVADAEKRLNKLEGKRPKMGTDLDEFEEKVSQWEKDKADTQKELDYWNDVQQRAKQENLDEQRENADLAAQWKKVAALGDAVSLHEYIMRQIYGGAKFIWDDAADKTKGLGSHLGLGNGAEKRSRRWMIGKKDDGALYPEQMAEVLAERYNADTGNDVEYDEVFNTMLDILRGYDRKSVLGNDILKEHEAGQFNEDTFNKEDEKRSKDAWAVEHGFEDFAAYEDYMKSLEGTVQPQGEGNGAAPAELMGEPVEPTDLEKPQAKEQAIEPATPTEPAAEPQGTVEETPKVEQPSEPKKEEKEEEPKGTFNPIEEAKNNIEKGQEKSESGEKPKGFWKNDADRERFEQLKNELLKKNSGQLNSFVDPEAFMMGVEMTYLLVKNGVIKFADYAKVMLDELGEAIRPYLKSYYNGARDMPNMKEYKKGMTPYNEVDEFDIDNFDKVKQNDGKKGDENAGNDVSLQKSDKEEREAFTNAVASDLEEALLWGDEKPYKSIVDVRKRAREVGMKVDEDGRTDILLQELVENGLVRAARKVVTDLRAKNLSRKEIYDTICQLYNLQPTITLRSSNRIKMQQYSTPLPMSFVAQMFIEAGEHTEGEIGLEPTAGNGMLVFATPAERLHVNELDETRLENLQGQGFKQVTNQDATKPFEGGRKYDFVIMNPPFGSSEAKNYDGKKISGLDPQITLNALESMKDNGRAAIIIGGNMEYGDNGAIKGNKAFFTYLYDHYHVKGIVDMDGSLYRKQGTTYPTRMILIDGRRSEEERAQTTVYPPVQSKAIPVVKNEQELYDTVEGLINSKEKTNGTEVLQGQNWKSLFDADYSQGAVEQGGRTEQPGKNDSPKPQGQRTETESEGNSGSSQPVSGGQSGPNNGNGKLESGNTGASGNGGSRGNTGNDNRGLGAVGASNSGNGLNAQKKKEEKPNSDNRLSYRPHNTAFSLESVAPAAMVESMDKAVTEVEQQHGNIDEFVTKELGYDSIEEMHNALAAEQVDSVAMAIHQMKQGQALVIGDQTGVGKGRQMAALIRWAVKQGKKPIFFTQKADLFTDIYRDLVDIGSGDLKPFIFNSDGAIVDAKGKAVYRPMSTAAQKEVFASGKVPDGYDFVVLTYSQVNTGDAISVAEQIEAAKKNGARVSKKKLEKMRPTPKATFLRAIAEDNYLLLDESHTAAGSGNTGGYLQSIMRKAKGATFASATFAKRPDTMPLYAIRTAMSKANVEPEKLIAIIERGGVTLQEIMSRALTNAGQMVRRERDMGDVVTDWKTVDDEETVRRARENYDKTIAAFNAIIQFQNTFVKPKVEEIDTDISIMAGSSDIKQGTDQMGVSNVPFASKTYNYTKQLMLALKVNAIVDEVDAQIKSGKHPVIALESTMESSLNDYAINEEIEEPTFSASLLRGLRTVMQYTIKDADGNEVHYTFKPSELGPAAEKAYEDLENFIRESTRGIFISPLDAIIDKLHEKGYKVGELTGRNVYVEQTSDGKAVVRRRTDKDKKRMQREFNDGTLDVLILNKSASTGISLHASSKFTDQRQRCMVIAQPLSDINDYMQMIGRTDRTGQVSRCYYVNLGLPVPAESRFLMMLSGKLKSLNANTTTSQESEANDVQAPDLLNKYGSQVVVEYLRDNPEIYEKMGEPLRANNERVSVSKLDEYEPQEGDARKITGYVALLTTKEQEDFYIDVVGRYNSLIQYLNDIGANDLHITVMPLRAKTLEKKVSSEGVDPNGENPFAQNAYLEKVEMDVLRKPMKSEEVHKLIEQVNNGQDGNAHREHIMEIVRSENDKKRETEEERYQRDLAKREEDLEKQIAKINASTKRTEEEKREAIERLKNDTLAAVEERHTRNTVRIDDAVTSMEQELSRMKVGDTFLIPDVLDSMIFSTSSPAIFCGYKAKESKITPSTTFAVFAVLDGRRKIEVKLSEYNVLRQIERVTDENYDAAHQTTLDNWDSSIPTGTRKEGYILTGNIIQAVSDSQNDRGGFTGQLISFTDEEGNVRDGILMPDNWNAGMLRNSGVPISARAADLKRGVDLKSTDGKVKVEKNYGYYSLSVPKTKKEGGKYFENEELLSLVTGNNFYPYRGQLRGDIAVEDIDDVLTILSNLGVRVEKAEEEDDIRFRDGEESGDIFVSNALRAVDGIKQEKATPEQWLKMIEKAGGLKAGEDKWMGLSEWLKGSDKKTLTKQEVQDFILQNQIQVDEVVYEKPNKDYTIKLQRLQDEFNAIISEMTENFYVLTKELDTFELDMESKYGDEWMIELSKEEGERFSNLVTRREKARQKTEEASKKAFEEMVSRYGDDFRKAFNVRESILSPKVNSNGEMLPVAKKLLGVKENINSVRLSYTTKGLDNKREIALVVPTIEPWNENDEVHFGDAGEGRAIAWIRFGETTQHIPEDGGEKRAEFERIAADNDKWYLEHPQLARYGIGSEELKKESEERNQRQRDALDAAEAVPTSPVRVLVIDEIQSKRHQEGREQGYQKKVNENLNFTKSASGTHWLITDKDNPDFFDNFPALGNETPEEANRRYSGSTGVPDAPFDKNWHELAMKRMLRYAAENGYDKIAWTTGEQQAARYDLSQKVDEIKVIGGVDNIFTVIGRKDGGILVQEDVEGEKGIAELIGKEMARKAYSNLKEGEEDYLNEDGAVSFTGDDLQIGGEGMKGFYDQMLPRFMDKYGKKWGVKTGKIELPDLEEAGQTMWAVDVTPEMKASVMQGQTMFRVREDAPPKKTGIGYKVFYLKDGKLYPPMVANPNGEDTPVGTWLDADAAPIATTSKTGRKKVKAGGKGTQGGSGSTLSYRPGWHLGQIPYAMQFNRGEKVDNPLGVTNKQGEVIKVGKYFPKDFVWAEVEYANDVDYQDEAMSYGYNEAGNFQHSLAGLPRLPENGSYTYRTNANPATDPWIITGAMKVNRILKPSEVDDLVRKAGREPQQRESGAITDEQIDALNKEIAAEKQSVADQKQSAVEQLASKLGVKVNIVDDVNSITHGNKQQQERRRNAKGWYNTSTGEVTIVLPNNRNVDDVVATTLHEVVAHKGLREMVGEERYNEFLDEVYSHLKKDLKEKVDKMAFDMFMNGLGKSKNTTQEHRRVAVDEMLGKLAEKGFEDFTESEKSIWQKLKEAVLKILDKFLDTLKLPKWFTLGDNELRYILWRSKERMERGKESPLDMAKDNIKRRELGLDEREGDDLFRDSDHDVADDMGIAGGHYERMMRNSLFQAQEAMQDSMLSLKVLQEGIEKETGKPILDFENAYLAENALSSTNKAELDLYNRMLMQPLIDEIASIAKKLYPGRKGRARRKEAINEISLYTIAKHGLERNEVFARRDADSSASNLYDDAIANAQQAVDADPLDQDAIDALDALKQQKQDYSDQEYDKNRERDYSGLTSLFETDDVADAEAKAQDAVDDFENAIGAEHTTDLWNCINNATQAILVKQKECGLLSDAQYQRASTMFQNYVPLRGFDDTVAEDVYEYFGGDFRVSGPVIRKAAGRTSLADNVFANIQSMADHGFMQANRNAMKQRFLMMAEGHKTDLVSVGQLWMAKNATTGEWELIYPELAADTLFKDAEDTIENFDDLMADLVKKDPDNYKKVADNPNIPYKVLSDRNKAMHSVVVKRGGKSRIVTINGNPRAALALNGMTNPNGDNTGFIQKSLGKINWVNRHLSQLYTTWNPDFVASNFCRDIIYSHAMTLVREDAAYNARFTWNHLKNANPITMARLIRKYEKGTLDDADDLERNFLDFMKYGGETGYKSSREDLDEYKRSIESELKKANSGTRQFFSALLHLLENANRSVENSARFAAYLTSREVGRSTMRAIKDAKEITVNFNKKGAGDAFLDTKGQTKLGNAAAMMSGAGRGLYVFWNAGVQGLTNALNTIKNKETRGKAIAMLSSIFALGVGNVIYQILAGGDDDDESNGYFDLPSYTRRSAFCMKIPGTKTWMTPPLPPEFKAIYGLGELAASVLTGKEHYEGSELALAVGNQIGQMLPLNPWESGSGVWWAPSSVKPLLEANMNIKWTGQPVQKETPYNTYAPEWTKAFSSADRNIVAATKWLNELGGGDEYKKANQEWLFDWSPAKIEYVLQGMMGGAYTFPSKLVKFGETVAGKRDFEWRNMPIANRFLTSGNDMTKKRAIDNEYFKYVDRLKSFQFRINGYNKDTKGSDEDKAKVSEKKLEELRKTEEFQKFAIFNDIKKRIDKMNKEYKATGSDELADSIMTLRKKANEVMRRSGEDLKHYIEVTFPREE